MATLRQLLIAGLATGAIYALVAIGFTLLWQTSQTINFAQGEFVMLPAFFVLAADEFGLPFWAAVLIGLAVRCCCSAGGFKRLLVDPMLRHGVLPLVISTMALVIFMKEAVKEFYTAEAQPFPAIVPADQRRHPRRRRLAAEPRRARRRGRGRAGAAVFPDAHAPGRQMQATAQNPTVARILGIPVERMILYTFLINAGLVALASLLITPIYLAKFSNGEMLGLVAFIAAIVGGFNQVRGAIAGGLLLGVVDNLAAAYVSTAVPRRDPAVPADRRHPVPAAGPARPRRGAHGMTARRSRLACRVALVAVAGGAAS